MHLKRWITAIIALPLLISLVYKGSPFLFFLVISAVSVLGLMEYFRIMGGTHSGNRIGGLTGVGLIAGVMIIWAAYLGALDLMIGILSLNLLVSGVIAFFQAGTDTRVSDRLVKQAVGVLYVPLLLSFMMLIRREEQGIAWLFFLMAVVFLGDTGAYYGGTYLGRHKLCPKVSPGKTIEGSVAGLLANVGAGFLFRSLMLLPISWGMCLVLSLLAGGAGQIGDLFESLLKRSANMKDSGGLLPGHGGVLDRIDAILFASPVLYLCIRYLV